MECNFFQFVLYGYIEYIMIYIYIFLNISSFNIYNSCFILFFFWTL